MGNRQGQRTELLQHVAEVEPGNTRDIAAAAVGMSGEQYSRARASGDEANPATVAGFSQQYSRARASGDDFTTVEKVEIARKIEEAMAGRHGSNQYATKEDVQHVAPASQGEKSRDIAAAAVGMSGVFCCHPSGKKLSINQHVGPEFD